MTAAKADACWVKYATSSTPATPWRVRPLFPCPRSALAGEVLLCQDMVVTLAYGDGSVATISYASDGHNGTAKERFEVLGQGHTALIDDYRRLVIDERVARKGQQDKGHVAQLREFRRSIAGGTDSNPQTLAALDSMRATLAAAESLRDGRMSQL